MNDKTYNCDLVRDENGDGIIQLPPDLMQHMGWDEHTILHISLLADDTVKVEEKTSWTVQEAQENIELILDNIQAHGTIHRIQDEKGREFLMRPVHEEDLT